MKKLLLSIVLSVLFTTLFAQEIFIKNEAAIGGYDAVAFFSDNKAIEGSKEFTYRWKNADWRFANQQNLDKFKAEPEKYAPQFGGYCAYGMSDGEGHKAPTLPETFTIIDDKLYFNYNMKVKEMWSKDREARITNANNNWPKLKLAQAH